jgi:F-box protein 11
MAGYPSGRSFVRAAVEAVLKARAAPVEMAYFAAREGEPAEYCERQVRACHVYVGLVGFRYGSRVPGQDDEVSYTELEFRTATDAGIRRLVFLLDEDAPIPPRLVDEDRAAVTAFRDRLRDAGVIVKTVGSPAELGEAVLHALYELREERRERPPWPAPPLERMADHGVLGEHPTARVVYRGADGRVHELRLRAGGTWTHAAVGDLAGAPAAADGAAVFGYAVDLGDGPAARVVYRDADGRINELWLRPGGTWTHGAIGADAFAPTAAGDPWGYRTGFDGADPHPTARVVYRGADGRVHELRLRAGGTWTHAAVGDLAGAPAAADGAAVFGYAVDLGDRSAGTGDDGEAIGRRFRQANDYAHAHGFTSAFPNFHEADYGLGVVHGTFLLGRDAAEWRDIPATELGNSDPRDAAGRFRATHDWAVRNGYLGGYPNFHRADHGGGTVYGTILIKRESAVWRDVPASELGNPPVDDVGARFRAAADWAVRRGFAAGFPNFHQADHGSGVVYGTILFPSDRIRWRDVYADALEIFGRFKFDSEIDVEQRRRLMKAHSAAIANTRCGALSDEEEDNLLEAYRRPVRHSIITVPDVDARAAVGGSRLWVNPRTLLSEDDDEIARTLVHLMMHCAGYTHSARIGADQPGGGAYFGSPPLRAESCAAGERKQRAFDASCRVCEEVNGVFSVRSRSCSAVATGKTWRVGMEDKTPVAFLSYSHFDDEHGGSEITAFRRALEGEIWVQTGCEDVRIFQDRDDIPLGDKWRERIDDSLDAVTFFIPVLTPKFFLSDQCRRELERFLDRERRRGRGKILPIYWITSVLLENESRRPGDVLVDELASRQREDWRHLRHRGIDDPLMRAAVGRLATAIIEMMEVKTHVVGQNSGGSFTSISDAMDAADPGDRVVVLPGRYEESLELNKPLDIVGQGARASIQVIADNKSALAFSAGTGRVRGLTLVQRGSRKISTVYVPSGEPTLADCDVSGDGDGVWIDGDANPRLEENYIHHMGGAGVVVDADGAGVIEGNYIADNAHRNIGIGRDANPTVRGNRLVRSQGAGIFIDHGRGVVEDNDITDNKRANILVKGSSSPSILRNRIRRSGKVGLQYCESGAGLVEDNDVTDSTYTNISITTGANPTIRGNRIRGSRQAGIHVHRNGLGIIEKNEITDNAASNVAVDTGGNPTIRGNRITRSGQHGISIRDGGAGVYDDNDIADHPLSNVEIAGGANPVIRRNRIGRSESHGIYLHDGGTGTIEDNEITDNTHSNIRVRQGSPEVRRNLITRSKKYGIYVGDGGAGTFEDNDLRGNAKGAWLLKGANQAQLHRVRNKVDSA